MQPAEFRRSVRDLVNFLDYAGEPAKLARFEAGELDVVGLDGDTLAFVEIKALIEKQLGPPTVDGKSERAADPLREDSLALLLGDVEEGGVLGAELTRDDTGEVVDLRRGLSECADGEVGYAPRVVRVHLCLDRSGGARGRAELLGCLVVVLMSLACALTFQPLATWPSAGIWPGP